MKYKIVRSVRVLISSIGDDPKAENGYSISRSRLGLFWKPIRRQGLRLFFKTYESALAFSCVLADSHNPITED